MKQPNLKVEYVTTSELIPYARNSRTHTEEQVAQIASSIREFGFTNPVLIDKENSIIAGHGRVSAAHLLKMKSLPCIRLEHLTETQRKAYVIADNKIAENSGWDWQGLTNVLQELKIENFDLAITGFEDWELDPLFKANWNPPPLRNEPPPGHHGEDSPYSSNSPDAYFNVEFTKDQSAVIKNAVGVWNNGKESNVAETVTAILALWLEART